MKKAFTLATLVILLINNRVNAAAVSLETAQNVALNFYKLNTSGFIKSGIGSSLNSCRKEADGTIDFYVFNLLPKGFVIVTADDRLEPVIAYSTESNFDIDWTKIGVKDWMDHTTAKIQYVINHNLPADERINNLWSSYNQGTNPGSTKDGTVSPLLSTVWGQHTPYSDLCPYNSADKVNCVSGCIATAMAQIMKFWNYPAQGSGNYSYDDAPPTYANNYGTQSVTFTGTEYGWSQMTSSPSGSNSPISTLVYQCAVSVATNFGDDKQGGSSAYMLANGSSTNPSAQNSFINYFGYNSHTLQGLLEANYTASQWSALLINDLNAGHPIQYEGQDASVGGHSWVCDGYDANGMFHMNWGWNGEYNGYFALSDLNPFSSYSFISQEAALIGIEPGSSSQTTGISSPGETNSLTVYPNPAQNVLHVHLSGDVAGQITVFDLAGQAIIRQNDLATDQNISTAQLADGTYILETESKGDIKRQKFIVAR